MTTRYRLSSGPTAKIVGTLALIATQAPAAALEGVGGAIEATTANATAPRALEASVLVGKGPMCGGRGR